MKWFDIDKEMSCHCGCEMPAGVRENEKALIETVLDEARETYGHPIRVNSGYRCVKYNRGIGVENSQHCAKQGSAAADIAPVNSEKIKDKSELERLARIIVQQNRFDQLILYPTFLHVSYKRYGGNRHQILRKVGTGYVPVSRKEVLGV